MTDSAKEKIEDAVKEIMKIVAHGYSEQDGMCNLPTPDEAISDVIRWLLAEREREVINECYKREKRYKVNQYGVRISYWSGYINNKSRMYKKYNLSEGTK